jgi:hypothetical protein
MISRILQILASSFRGADRRFVPTDATGESAARMQIRFQIGFNA